jgi:hypothetical protein
MTSERVLRGLQADWTRRLSETRKEMDGQKEEWKKESKRQRKEWRVEKEGLEEQLVNVTRERDELAVVLQNQKDIKFVASLFCNLARRKLHSGLKEGKSRLIQSYSNSTSSISSRLRYGRGSGVNRMLTVGGAKNEREERRFGSLVRRFVQRLHSLKERSRHRRNDEILSPNLPHSTVQDQNTQKHNTKSEHMPQLIRKNPRRSRLYHPESVFERRTIRDPDVPDFMKR